MAVAVAADDLEQLGAALFGKGDAGGIVVIAHDVDDFYFVELVDLLELKQERVELFRDDAVIVDVHTADVGAGGHQHAGVNEVAGPGGDDDVAGIDEGIGEQGEKLLT